MTKVRQEPHNPKPGVFPGGKIDCFPLPDLSGAPILAPLNDFRAIDANRGGTLTRDEWRRAGLSRPLFNAYDANSDGVISQREYLTGRRAEAEFDRKDRDRNGSLSRWEWGAALAGRASDLARGGLEKVCDAFRWPFAPVPTDSQYWFDRADTNRDGKVSRPEFVKGRIRSGGIIV